MCDIEVLSAEKSVDRHIMAIFMAGQGKLPYFNTMYGINSRKWISYIKFDHICRIHFQEICTTSVWPYLTVDGGKDGQSRSLAHKI